MWKKRPTTSPRKREKTLRSTNGKKRGWEKMHDNCIFISAKEKKNIDELKTLLYQRVKEIHTTRFPLQRFPVSTLRRNNDRRRILNP